jgi:hypothetical protein
VVIDRLFRDSGQPKRRPHVAEVLIDSVPRAPGWAEGSDGRARSIEPHAVEFWLQTPP